MVPFNNNCTILEIALFSLFSNNFPVLTKVVPYISFLRLIQIFYECTIVFIYTSKNNSSTKPSLIEVSIKNNLIDNILPQSYTKYDTELHSMKLCIFLNSRQVRGDRHSAQKIL